MLQASKNSTITKLQMLLHIMQCVVLFHLHTVAAPAVCSCWDTSGSPFVREHDGLGPNIGVRYDSRSAKGPAAAGSKMVTPKRESMVMLLQKIFENFFKNPAFWKVSKTESKWQFLCPPYLAPERECKKAWKTKEAYIKTDYHVYFMF